MKRKLPLTSGFFVVLLLLAKVEICCGQETMRVILPQNRTSVTGGYIHLIVAVDPARIDRISLVRNKKEPLVVEVQQENKRTLADGMIITCKVLDLDAGENKITITGDWQGKKVAEKLQQVYYAAKYSPDKNTPPPEYQNYVFHSVKNEGLCLACHQELAAVPKEVNVLSASPCYKCHAYMLAGTMKHGPAAVGDCASCHSGAGKGKYAVAQPVRKVCLNCHEEAIKSWEVKKYTHGPTATGDCTICHFPHSSNEKFFLQKKTNELCIGCHEEKASGKHVISSFGGNSHPLTGKTNPRQPDRSFSCASCHSPHAANSRALFPVDTPGGVFGICQACHKK